MPEIDDLLARDGIDWRTDIDARTTPRDAPALLDWLADAPTDRDSHPKWPSAPVRGRVVVALAVATVAILAAVLAVQSSTRRDAHPTGAHPTTHAPTPYVQTAAWAHEGARISAMKRAAHASGAPYPPSTLPKGYGTWADLSDPVNVTGPGPLVLTVKVPASVDVSGVGSGLGIVTPPDAKFIVLVQRFTETRNHNGTATVHIYAIVQKFRQPYYGFTAWAY